MALDEARGLLATFRKQVLGGGGGDAGATLLSLKRIMVNFRALPPMCGASDNARDELLTARETLELAALSNLRTGDDAAFQRHLAQLAVYYLDFKDALPESELRYVITGLNLVNMLVSGRRADFHCELELLTEHERANPHVAFACQLDTFMTEGQYNKVMAAGEAMPSEHYAPFVGRLTETVRLDIAACVASAYKSLSAESACKLLLLPNAAALDDFVRGQDGWSMRAGAVHFDGHDRAAAEVPSHDLIASTLRYANELERIV